MNIMYKSQKLHALRLYRSSIKRATKLKKNFRLELKTIPYSKAYYCSRFLSEKNYF